MSSSSISMSISRDSSRSVPSEIAFYAVPPAHGPVDGYSYAGLKIVQTLNSMGIQTPWRDDAARVSISFCQPDWYSQAENQFRIGYTPWESTEIPSWWVQHMNSMSLMWTTSSFCRDVFISNGVENDIIVVPHGIDEHDFPLRKRSYSEPFTFIHIGEPAVRKNGQMVVDAFLEVFGKDDSTRLIIKANGHAECRLREPFGPVDRHPRIELIKDRYSVSELAMLYLRAHALIYPSRGEGFGLIPFQGICTGLPTAAVVWGGITEFGEHCIPIDYRVVDSGHDYHIGQWAEPDFDSVCRVMLDIREHYDTYARKAYESAIFLRQEMSWSRILTRALDVTFSCQAVD